MCKCNGELVNHLLLHCPLARELWDLLVCLVGMPYSVAALLESWRGAMVACRSKEVWGAAPACLIWCIWSEKNQRTFEGVELSIPNLKFVFLRTLFNWCCTSATFSMNSFMEFLLDLCLSC